MSSDLALRLESVGKRYQIQHQVDRVDTLTKAALHRIRHPRYRAATEEFWALRDVSFSVSRGEVVGVVGRNGAGKSTLLKVLARITSPTSGTLDLYGRLGSLLEVGTGFHPELTGRENIFLNGSILGMKHQEIARKFDEIVDFSGVSQFLDTPVKRYSSGMYVRLAFSVAAHLDADTLLVDEVLAVGDSDFQQRCLGKMQDVSTSGRTVIFVSHQLQSVRALCTRGLFMQGGRVMADGPVEHVIDRYLDSYAEAVTDEVPHLRPGTGEVRLRRVAAGTGAYTCSAPKDLSFEVSRHSGSPVKYWVAMHVVDARGSTLVQLDTRLVGGFWSSEREAAATVRLESPWLKPGAYRVDAFLCSSSGVLDQWERATTFQVAPVYPYAFAASQDGTEHGLVLPSFTVLDSTGSQKAPDARSGRSATQRGPAR